METFPKFKRSKSNDDGAVHPPPCDFYADVNGSNTTRPPCVNESTGYVSVCTEYYNENPATKPPKFDFLDKLLLQLQERAAPSTVHVVAPNASGKPNVQ